MSDPQLTSIPGVGPATARALAESGFSTIQQLANASQAQLAKVPGFGTVRAGAVIAAAQTQVSTSGQALAGSTESKKDKKGKKKKKKKKDGKKKDKKGKKKDGKKKRKK